MKTYQITDQLCFGDKVYVHLNEGEIFTDYRFNRYVQSLEFDTVEQAKQWIAEALSNE